MTLEHEIEDDVRRMLHLHADDAHVSVDAWDQIAARLDEPPVSSRKLVALAGGLVAAALLAVAFFVSQHNTSTTPRVGLTTPSSAPAPRQPPYVWLGNAGQDARAVVEAYLKDRTGVDVTTASYDFVTEAEVRATFLSRDVATEVLGEKRGSRWVVISAASELVPIHDPSFDGTMSTAIVSPESAGQLWIGFGDAGWDPPGPVDAHESVPLRRAGQRSLRALLRTSDGTIGLSEMWPAKNPLTVAREYLDESLDLSQVAINLDGFQSGDTTSGEIPYSIDRGISGTILMRQDAGGSWLVAGITSEQLAVHVDRTTGGLEVAVSELDADTVAITLTNGGMPETTVTVSPGQTVGAQRVHASGVRAVARKDGKVVAIFENQLD